MSYSFPSELNYEMLSRMYPGVKQEFRRQPINAQSCKTGSMVILQLNKMSRTFANPATIGVRYNLELSYTTGATDASLITTPATTGTNATPAFTTVTPDSSVNLLGNAMSVFSRYVTSAAGQTFDQIDYPGRLMNAITNCTLSAEDKRHMVSFGYNDEINTSTNLGWGEVVYQVKNSIVKKNISFVVPLIGCLNASKLIPMFVSDIQIDLTVAAISECIKSIGNITVSAIEINSVELIAETLTLEESSFNELMAMYPGVINIKSESYSYSAGAVIPAGASGSIDQTIPFSLNSMKSFLWWCSPSDAFSRNFSGVNPNLRDYQLQIGASSYPVQPIKTNSISEIYYQNSKAFGAFYAGSHNGSCNRSNMNKASTAGGEYVDYETDATVPFANRYNESNKFYCFLDLEVLNQLKQNLYSGISTRSNSNLLRLNIERATKAAVTNNIHMYACYDVVLNFDYVNGKITYSN